jgi:hypothetical protein
MIHHFSIPARDPRHVAEVLAELFGGTVTGFGPRAGGYIAWSGDAHGTAIEIYPVGTEMFPPPSGVGQANFRTVPGASGFTSTHAAVSVERSEAEILALGQREGWRAVRLDRGGFEVIEFWIENAVMLEVLTPQMAADYLRATGS